MYGVTDPNELRGRMQKLGGNHEVFLLSYDYIPFTYMCICLSSCMNGSFHHVVQVFAVLQCTWNWQFSLKLDCTSLFVEELVHVRGTVLVVVSLCVQHVLLSMCAFIQSPFLSFFHQYQSKHLETSGQCVPTSQTIQANCITSCQWKVGISAVNCDVSVDKICDETIHWTDVMTFTATAFSEWGNSLLCYNAGPGL